MGDPQLERRLQVEREGRIENPHSTLVGRGKEEVKSALLNGIHSVEFD